jgi:hypothetical protein
MTPIRAVSEQARRSLQDFLKLESSGGILLAAAALLAMVLANTPLAGWYEGILATHLTMTLGDFGVDKPLLLWINDGLMAVFFLLIGLEVKREMVQGQLSSPGQVVLPAVAAAGGLLVPAVVYLVLTRDVPEAAGGWAIPAATDIAFALAILSRLGPRVPTGLKDRGVLFRRPEPAVDAAGAGRHRGADRAQPARRHPHRALPLDRLADLAVRAQIRGPRDAGGGGGGRVYPLAWR